MKTHSDFNFWYNEIADMPTKDENGEWYDLETGLPFIEREIKKKTLEDIKEEKINALDGEQRDYLRSHDLAKHESFWRRFRNVKSSSIIKKLVEYDLLLNQENDAHKSGDFDRRDSVRDERRRFKVECGVKQ